MRAAAAALSLAGPAAAQPWSLSVSGGSALNVPLPVTLRQPGNPEIRRTAHATTRPFRHHAPYYAWRVGRGAWEFEHIHTKVYWMNRPPTVEEFFISHGFNYFLVNRAYDRDGWIWRLGAGPVVTHPETTVRGRRFSRSGGGTLGGGYYLSGAGAQAAVSRRFPLVSRLSALLEAKVTGAFTNIPISGGNADVPHLALHYLAGLSWEFR